MHLRAIGDGRREDELVPSLSEELGFARPLAGIVDEINRLRALPADQYQPASELAVLDAPKRGPGRPKKA